MRKSNNSGMIIAGGTAGIVNALLGAGGGMVLVPLLSSLSDIDEGQIFPSSVSIILPICLITLSFHFTQNGLPYHDAWPYLLGSIGGGILAGIFGKRIPVKWLHRLLGILIIWGGVRYLC